jgi:hypothetical protein
MGVRSIKAHRGCEDHFAAVLVQGIGFEVKASHVPQALIDDTMTVDHDKFKRPPAGATVFYGGIFNYCPACGEKINLSECGAAARSR